MTNKENHFKMWKWLAENPDMDKADYFNYAGITPDIRPYGHCYACDEAIARMRADIGGPDSACYYCPIVWDPDGSHPRDEGITCRGYGSPFHTWEHSNLYRAAGAHALLALTWHDDKYFTEGD